MTRKLEMNNLKISPKELLINNLVPIMFICICVVGIPISGYSGSYLLNEILSRLGRNSFLVLSLLIPVMAGMGLNFGMTLGAMAGQIGLIFVSDWNVVGIPAMVLAAIISTPISILLGWLCGTILNNAKGREMVTSYIIGFFMNGVYQLVVLYFMGSIIPITSQPSRRIASTAFKLLPPVEIRSSITTTFMPGRNSPSIKFSKP